MIRGEDSCSQMRHTLMKHMEGRATTRERALLEFHIKGCEACQEAVAVFEAVSPKVGELCAPDDFEDCVLGKIKSVSARNKSAAYLPWAVLLSLMLLPDLEHVTYAGESFAKAVYMWTVNIVIYVSQWISINLGDMINSWLVVEAMTVVVFACAVATCWGVVQKNRHPSL